MENVVLAIHLILALLLIGIVLLQRSEGGGLGMGGGGAISGRAAATALGKATWIIAVAFIATSITLTVLAARSSSTGSVVDQLEGTLPATEPLTPDAGSLGAVPEADLGAVPAVEPPATDAPATPPPAEN
jgi:preprotein translocase subunit SecG